MDRSTTKQLWYSCAIVMHLKYVQHVIFPCGSSRSAPWGAHMMVILKGWLTESAKTVEKATRLRVAVDVIATGWRCFCFFSGFVSCFFIFSFFQMLFSMFSYRSSFVLEMSQFGWSMVKSWMIHGSLWFLSFSMLSGWWRFQTWLLCSMTHWNGRHPNWRSHISRFFLHHQPVVVDAENVDANPSPSPGWFCGPECQRSAWPTHKLSCGKDSKASKDLESAKLEPTSSEKTLDSKLRCGFHT